MATVDDDVQKMLNDAFDATNNQLTTKSVGTDSGTRGKGLDVADIWRRVFDTDGTIRIVS